MLQIAPSAYRRHAARQRNPELRSARAKRDEALMPQIERVWKANLRVYGADKVWKQLNREDVPVARCSVERLMRRLGLARRAPRQSGSHYRSRPIDALSAGSGQSAV